MNRLERIKSTLSILSPKKLEILDLSHMHKNHFDSPDEHTHLKLIISIDFSQLEKSILTPLYDTMLKSNRLLATHRIINNLLKDEFVSGLHALEIELF
jgi:BolA protein